MLGALENESVLTSIGRQMLRLPMHPRYSRMLIEASQRGCVPDAALCACTRQRARFVGIARGPQRRPQTRARPRNVRGQHRIRTSSRSCAPTILRGSQQLQFRPLPQLMASMPRSPARWSKPTNKFSTPPSQQRLHDRAADSASPDKNDEALLPLPDGGFYRPTRQTPRARQSPPAT